MNKIDSNDPAVRYAVMKTFNFKCFYTGKSLGITDLTLDHVVPRSMKKNPVALLNYLQEVGIKDPEQFELESLYNLVPCDRDFNIRIKGDILLDPKKASIILQKVAEKVPQIEKNIENFRKNIDVEEYSLRLIQGFSLFEKEERECKAEEIYDSLVGGKGNEEIFLEGRRISLYEGEERIFSYSKKNVWLYGFLPTEYRKGSCLLTFRNLKIRDCMITFDHEAIMSTFTLGIQTQNFYELRSFVVGTHMNNPDLFLIQLGNNRFSLNRDELHQLCEVIDDFTHEYLQACLNIEQKWMTMRFEKSKMREHGYRLMKVKRGLWNVMLQFSHEFDYHKGNSSWHRFQAAEGLLILNNDSRNDRYIKGPIAFIFPEQVEQDYSSLQKNDDEIWLVWDPSIPLSIAKYIPQGEDKIPFWDAQTTFEWIVNEWIPYLIYYYYKPVKKGLIRKKLPYDEFIKNFNIENYVQKKFDNQFEQSWRQYPSLHELIEIVNKIQYFYSVTQNKVFFKSEDWKGLYASITFLLRRIPLISYDYIVTNLSFLERDMNITEVVDVIEKYKESFAEVPYDASKIDLACRCLLELLHQADEKLTDMELNYIANIIKPFWEKYIYMKTIRRLT